MAGSRQGLSQEESWVPCCALEVGDLGHVGVLVTQRHQHV